jgi:hypothetical protein
VQRLIPGIAILLAYAITPGAGEITENVVHFLLDGHAAHGQHQAEEAPSGDTHGCSGPFQDCPCHGTSAFVADTRAVEIEFAKHEIGSFKWFVANLESAGVLSGVFRPPIS